ncbi:MAG: aminomethyl-transferring glycine dehydrogenase subunit GcvPA [Desulfovibrio sp.]|nr:aminomethyl-transferring glycine dehydrogenase subunit GcvPA [Desulfovibrio sp.]
MPYIPHTPEQTQEMLKVVGVASLEALFQDIPASMRPRSFNLPDGMSEHAVCARLEELARANKTDVISFLGGGFYDHHIPAIVDALSSRGEFLTAYTPYQAEASQGSLQAIFEYQTAVCRLLDMDCANASVYDGGSALFEACMMAVRATKRSRLVVDECLSPIYRTMLATYTTNLQLELVTVPHGGGVSNVQALVDAMDDRTAAMVVQNPTFFGTIHDYTALFAQAKAKGVVSVLAAYPVLQSILKTPGQMGADVAVAEGQSLGLPLSFGGPYLGIMTCSRDLVRQMPGRIVGRTVDHQGRTGYVLTLQAREQHIRRAKATSNICSNQALCAFRAYVTLCVLGPQGLARMAEDAVDKAHYAATRLAALPGVRLLADAPFGNEFAVVLPKNAHEVVDKCASRGLVPGFPLGGYYAGMEHVLLVACTEKTSREQIGHLAEMVGGML